MAKSKLILGDAAHQHHSADLIMTDPPYEMSGGELANILENIMADHIVLITTMRQLIEFVNASNWVLNFDFVLDGVAPKKSKSLHQPNYTHQTAVYMTRNHAASRFNRKLRQRSDVFEANGYWPTIFHAPRNNSQTHGHAKNQAAITDILGSFDVESVIDPFAGSGTTAFAAFELDIHFIAIEKDRETFSALKSAMRFLSILSVEVIEDGQSE